MSTMAMRKKKQCGRRRRGKKDTILDFTKRAKKSSDREARGVAPALDPKLLERGKRSSRKNKLSITTANRDYDNNLELPDEIVQREFESTGQFFRRIDRLVAKAKVEASLESRFDMNLPKNKDKEKPKGISTDKS